MSHQAEKGETYVSPGETRLIDIIILKLANPCYTSLHGCHALSIILPFMISKCLLQSRKLIVGMPEDAMQRKTIDRMASFGAF